NSPYLDYLLAQIEEVLRNYDADGIFLDICGVRWCHCSYCIDSVKKQGKDPADIANMAEMGEKTYANYTKRVKELIHGIKPGMPIFHNGGHILRGRRDFAYMNTHLELESLPTGGWGYDHFPLSARYVENLGLDYLGMTGKFHTTWGEFGGFKHPNALKYETALSIANGARCSIGDQLHPTGFMDPATYELIGSAYSEIEKKEQYCVDTANIADIALLSVEAAQVSGYIKNTDEHTGRSDVGAARMLLEGKYLFDVVDTENDFKRYKVLILPDHIRVCGQLKDKIADFINSGGKMLATGESGIDDTGFAIDFGVKWLGANPYRPDYCKPHFKLNNIGDTSFVIYSQGQKIETTGAAVLATRENPYFNREKNMFCSHQHTPNSHESGGPGMTESPYGIYIAWNVFEEYATKGSFILREIVSYALDRLLGERKTISTNLPAQGIVTLRHQQHKNRYINHLLYASPVKRGEGIEVIEDILPLYDIRVKVRIPHKVKKVYIAPDIQSIEFSQTGDLVAFTVPKIWCHSMVVVEC
ncbi:MAG TPA: beta-galactosidase trimerization domain-containing protein, partial [Clostridia bacterium]|nr:beta-galactosidase trimerization domain-containing protein [Clostridia bacterium]